MKDYRSLEHKIRDLVRESAENRNTEIRRKVANVGRPDDNVKDETSKLAKQGEIKTKVIDEAADDEMKKKKPEDDKAPKDSQTEDDPKKIKGGSKTDVDLEPKTNDAPEEQEQEDKVSKKARNQENSKIGAKGVKEETMTGKLTLGSSESQINAIKEAMKAMRGVCPVCGKNPCQCSGDVKEELKGGQKKLDKNHNGKLDKQDFKMLRKEEVEQIDELDRNGMLQRYADKTRKQVEGGEKPTDYRAAGRLMAGKKRWGGTGGIPAAKVPAVTREEVEPIDEAGRVLPDLTAKEPEMKHSKEYQARLDKKKESRKDLENFKATVYKMKGAELNKEEVEFSDAELARIEEIAKGL